MGGKKQVPGAGCGKSQSFFVLQVFKICPPIYEYYTDRVESFGLDECWLDVSESTLLFGDGTKIANEIRERIKRELGVTVSVGVSYNKVFAKLGSDMKKPDAVTVITENDFKEKIWGLPVEALLYVGIQQKRNLTIWLFYYRRFGQLPFGISRKAIGKMGIYPVELCKRL